MQHRHGKTTILIITIVFAVMDLINDLEFKKEEINHGRSKAGRSNG